jgi:hypothetical protein
MNIEKVKDFSRKDLARKFYEEKFTKGVEVGVCRGKYSKTLCRRNPRLKLFGVDDYDIVELRAGRIGKEGQEDYRKEALERLEPYNFELIRKPSMEAVLKFPFGSIDFVYIDAGHEFDYVMSDVIEWGKRVRKGGIISGHDYYNFRDGGVIDAVNLYCNIHKVETLYLTDEGGDRRSSWFFYKIW